MEHLQQVLSLVGESQSCSNCFAREPKASEPSVSQAPAYQTTEPVVGETQGLQSRQPAECLWGETRELVVS